MSATNITMSTSDIHTYIKAGESKFSIKSGTSNKLYKYQIRQGTSYSGGVMYYVKAREYGGIGVSYNYIGVIYDEDLHLTVTEKSKPEFGAIDALNYLLMNIGKGKLHPKLTFIPSDYCAKCGRVLTKESSVVRGIGPECIKQVKRYA